MVADIDSTLGLLKAQREFEQGFQDSELEKTTALFSSRLSSFAVPQTLMVSTPSLSSSWIEELWFLEKNHGR